MSGTYLPVDLATVEHGFGDFVIRGVEVEEEAGKAVASAGDISGDGFADLILGAPDAYASGAYGSGGTEVLAGASYVVVGHAGGFPAAIDLAGIARGDGGFIIRGEDDFDYSGASVASAGEVLDFASGTDVLEVSAAGFGTSHVEASHQALPPTPQAPRPPPAGVGLFVFDPTMCCSSGTRTTTAARRRRRYPVDDPVALTAADLLVIA